MGIEAYGLRYLDFIEETIVDGDGLRDSIYLAGCRHACPGCHNPESWDGRAGQLVTEVFVDRVITRIQDNPLLSGLTVSGGDPFFHPEALYELLRRIKEGCGCNIWCYTGYTLERLVRKEELLAPLEFIDTLVDGPFIQAQLSPELAFRGSRNQRLIRNPMAEAEKLLKTMPPRGLVP